MVNRSLALAMAAMAAQGLLLDRPIDIMADPYHQPSRERGRSNADREASARAAAKRERKAAKNKRRFA
jgi:hypothetical protein